MENDGSIETTSIISLNGYLQNKSMLIVPNPSQGAFIIKNSTIGNIVSIYDQLGRLVFSTTLKVNEQEINISHIPNGNYIIRIHSQNNVIVEKLIISK